MTNDQKITDIDIFIAVAGKTGAGKTTLAHKIIGEEYEAALDPNPTTQKCEILKSKVDKGRIRLNVIDNPGLLVGEEKEKLQKLFDYMYTCTKKKDKKSYLDLLLYCVPVTPASKFGDHNPKIMESIQTEFGKDIWKNCIIAFTFANFIVKKKTYEAYIKKYAQEFNDELLQKLGVQDIKVKTIFEIDDEQNLENVIIAVPVGDDDNDEVMPGYKSEKKWLDILHDKMTAKAKDNCKLELQQFWSIKFGPMSGAAVATGGTIGGIAGAAVGGAVGGGIKGLTIGSKCGLVVGPKGALVGAVTAGTVGAVLGAAVGVINPHYECCRKAVLIKDEKEEEGKKNK